MSGTIEDPTATASDGAAETPVEGAQAEVVVETAAAATEGDAPKETDGAEQPAAPKKGWQETRIAQLTARNAAITRELEEARALVEQAIKPGEGAPAATEAEVERRAAALVAEREFQRTLNAWDAKGVKEFPDFRERCATLAGMGLSLAEKPDFVSCIAEMDDGHKIAAYLADHPEEAMEIAALPTHRIGLRLAKLSSGISKPPAVSKAPAPMEPVAGAVTTEFDPFNPKTDMDAWAKNFRESSRLFGRRA